MNKVKAFLLGMQEFRLSFTARYEDDGLSVAYDRGRDFAHWLTFRRFDA